MAPQRHSVWGGQTEDSALHKQAYTNGDNKRVQAIYNTIMLHALYSSKALASIACYTEGGGGSRAFPNNNNLLPPLPHPPSPPRQPISQMLSSTEVNYSLFPGWWVQTSDVGCSAPLSMSPCPHCQSGESAPVLTASPEAERRRNQQGRR